MAIKINLGTIPSIFTKMRIYRSVDSAVVFDESKFLEEVPVASSYTDSSTTRDRTAKAFYYGVRLSTAGGVIQDVGPFNIRNVYDSDYLHGYDLPHPFKTGNANFGIYHTDATNEFTPSTADVVSLIRSKYPELTAIYPTDQKRVISLNGKLYLWGAPYVMGSMSYTSMITLVVNYRKNNMELPQNDSWTITRNGVKWELTMLDSNEQSIVGKFINGCAIGDSPMPPHGTITQPARMAAPIYGNDTAYSTLNGSNLADGAFGMGNQGTSSSSVAQYPSFVMKYVGRV